MTNGQDANVTEGPSTGPEHDSQPGRHGLRRPVDLAFVEDLKDGVYGVDHDGLCTFVNAAALRMLGYASADELLGRQMHEAVHHTRPDGTPYPVEACPLLHTLTSGRPVRLDHEMLWRKDGTSFIARYSPFPVTRQGPAGNAEAKADHAAARRAG